MRGFLPPVFIAWREVIEGFYVLIVSDCFGLWRGELGSFQIAKPQSAFNTYLVREGECLVPSCLYLSPFADLKCSFEPMPSPDRLETPESGYA